MNSTKPYICLGTFMTQLLRFVDSTTNARMRAEGNTDEHSERLIYKGLIDIYRMCNVSINERTLKTYASDVKSCKESRPEFAKFNNHDVLKDFEADIKRKKSIALEWMQDFVSDYISLNTKSCKERIVKIMLKMIAEDAYIEPGQKFYILGNGKSVAKSEIHCLREISIEPLLLGILHFIITKRADNNESGAATYAAMSENEYNDWLEEYDISFLDKITLLDRSGISEKASDSRDNKINDESRTSSEDSIGQDEKTENSFQSDDTGSKSNAFTITPNVTQYVQEQIIHNNKTIINNAPIEHIDTINF